MVENTFNIMTRRLAWKQSQSPFNTSISLELILILATAVWVIYFILTRIQPGQRTPEPPLTFDVLSCYK